MLRLLVSIILLLINSNPLLASATNEAMEKWFQSDSIEPPSRSTDSQLTFISPPKDKPALHSINNITITPQSLQTGWVRLQQCYVQLDPVPEMEVTYLYKAMRKLEITSASNIRQAYIENNSVQMRDVGKKAKLCVSAEVRILYKDKDRSYKLVNGPFHRQFLDSFFPYHLTMNIHYPSALLELTGHSPAQQAGFTVNKSRQSISVDCYFSGKLYTEFVFKEAGQ